MAVPSVSCIYGLGTRHSYLDRSVELDVGGEVDLPHRRHVEHDTEGRPAPVLPTQGIQCREVGFGQLAPKAKEIWMSA